MTFYIWLNLIFLIGFSQIRFSSGRTAESFFVNESDPMKPRKVVGRYRELALFQKMKDSFDATFLAVYGRRRVGKTFLIRNALHDLIRFELIGLHNGSIAEQLVNFSESLRQASHGEARQKWVTCIMECCIQRTGGVLRDASEEGKICIVH